jgi:aspartyl protease family protein
MRKKLSLLALIGMTSMSAQAAEIGVVGLFNGRALLVVDGAAPKIYAVGEQVGDARLVAADSDGATIEVKGKRKVLRMGEHVYRTSASSGNSKVIIKSDSRGQFFCDVQVNGVTVKMLVDTGASHISISTSEATRMGINYREGKRGFSETANGRTAVYLVTANTVKLGDIEVNQVDTIVHENGLPFGLLGMSFLNRLQMQRNGDEMVLTKRF